MPFIQVKTNAEINANDEISIKSKLGELIKIIPGKSENWLMVQLSGGKKMYFKGSDEKCAMIEVKIYGKASSEAYDKLTYELTNLISNTLNIPSTRIYVSYFETPNWGFAGSNF